jgi:NodT family efflux transporter outer membrane factor (OMF) lipoprotein
MVNTAVGGTGRVLASVVLVGWLAGCAVGPDFRRPAPPAASAYLPGTQPSETVAAEGPGGAKQRFEPGTDIPAEWWSLFRSESLDQRIRLALEESPTLAQARARLVQAREDLAARAGATRYPAVDAGISAERRKLNLASLGVSTVPDPGPFTLYNASISVSYVLDLFGGNRRALEALGAKVDYREFELEAARRTLAANVVNASIRQDSLRARMKIVQDLLEAQGRQFAIAEERYKAGGISALDVRNQNLLLDQTRALLPPLERELARVTHQLAVYLGREPAMAATDAFDLDGLHLPEEVPLRVPSTLARKRPDIRAAEALWHQASANVGVATADLFPRITLSGSLGSQRTDSGDLLIGANVWSIAGNLMQPIFRGGELRARKRSAVAAYDEAAAAYRQTVLQGLQEVADALSALDMDARTLKIRADAAGHARAGYEIARQRYLAGGISQLELLDAQRQLLQSEFDRVQAQADRYADTAALLHALGGGWKDGE